MTDSPSGDNRPTNMWEELNRPKERASEVPQSEEERDDKAGVPLAGIVGGAVAIAAVAFAGFIVMGGDGVVEEPTAVVQDDQLALSDEESAGVSADTDGADVTDAGSADADGSDPMDGDDAAGDSNEDESRNSESNNGEDASGDTYSPPVPVGAEGNYSVLSRGKLYLRGELPSPLIAIGAVNALEEIMGAGNVIDEYVINPDAPFEMGQASDVYIDDTVLFEVGSAAIAPDFYPLLGLGVVLMQVQDGVTIEVYGHTDSTGSDDANLALSQARVDAVQAFWVSQGADPSRITAVGLGETDPVADNSTAEGRQANRRVEIVITGFVFGM